MRAGRVGCFPTERGELPRPSVTLELLHLEYLREHPDGYRYTAPSAMRTGDGSPHAVL
jgi:hypothetical protein